MHSHKQPVSSPWLATVSTGTYTTTLLPTLLPTNPHTYTPTPTHTHTYHPPTIYSPPMPPHYPTVCLTTIPTPTDKPPYCPLSPPRTSTIPHPSPTPLHLTHHSSPQAHSTLSPSTDHRTTTHSHTYTFSTTTFHPAGLAPTHHSPLTDPGSLTHLTCPHSTPHPPPTL